MYIRTRACNLKCRTQQKQTRYCIATTRRGGLLSRAPPHRSPAPPRTVDRGASGPACRSWPARTHRSAHPTSPTPRLGGGPAEPCLDLPMDAAEARSRGARRAHVGHPAPLANCELRAANSGLPPATGQVHRRAEVRRRDSAGMSVCASGARRGGCRPRPGPVEEADPRAVDSDSVRGLRRSNGGAERTKLSAELCIRARTRRSTGAAREGLLLPPKMGPR